MASSGSSAAAANNSSKAFDFASDDILCSYEDYHDNNPTSHSDSLIAVTTSTKDFQKSRMARSSVLPTSNIYTQPEDTLNQELVSSIDRTMKKHTDNLMRFLEGISSRLSQLELYCYNLDKSIGEIRSDLVRDHDEADTKLKSLDKNLQEVHRSVQILRDKQELADTQKELAKLQLVQKDSSSEEKTPAPKKADDSSEPRDMQLALALPNQFPPQPQPQPQPQPSRSMEQQQSYLQPSQTPPQPLNQPPPLYYMPPSQVQNPHTQNAAPQGLYMPADSVYRAQPMAPQPAQSQINQTLPSQPYPPYPQQWSQQVAQPQPVRPPQQPPIQPQSQANPSPAGAYPPYMRSQPTNPPPPETTTGSMPLRSSYSGIPQPGVGHGEALPYGYGGAGRQVPPQPQPQQQLQPQHMKGGFTTQPVEGYGASGPHPPVSSGGSYMMYESEGGRPHQPPQQPSYAPGGYPAGGYPPGGYPPVSVAQNPLPTSSAGLMARNQNAPQYFRNRPHGELIDKLVSMGYRGDHVASIIQRLEERGRPIDFNAVLDTLNGGSSGGSQRGW